jgi:hypothetical protein
MPEHAHEANKSGSDDAAHRFPTKLEDQVNASVPAQDMFRPDIDQMRRPTTGGPQGGIGTQFSRMLPPLHGHSLHNIAQEEQHGRPTHEMLQRQIQAAQNMGLNSPYMHGYGTGAYPAPVMSNTRTSLSLGQPQRGSALLPGFPDAFQHQIHRHHIELDDSRNHLGGISAYGSRFSSRQPSVFADHGQLSAPGSRVASPEPPVLGGGLQRQGSRPPSRQASRQSSAENLRTSLNSNATRLDEDGRYILKFPMLPRNLNSKVTRLSFPVSTFTD